MQESPIGRICNELKHFYLDGERAGKEAARKRRSAGLPPSNSMFHISICYNFRKFRGGSGTKISLMASSTPKPVALAKYNVGNLTPEQITKFRQEHFVFDEVSTDQELVCCIELDEAGLEYYMRLFATTCAVEINRYFAMQIDLARQTGTEPKFN